MWSNLPGNIEQNIELVIESSLCSIKFAHEQSTRQTSRFESKFLFSLFHFDAS